MPGALREERATSMCVYGPVLATLLQRICVFMTHVCQYVRIYVCMSRLVHVCAYNFTFVCSISTRRYSAVYADMPSTAWSIRVALVSLYESGLAAHQVCRGVLTQNCVDTCKLACVCLFRALTQRASVTSGYESVLRGTVVCATQDMWTCVCVSRYGYGVHAACQVFLTNEYSPRSRSRSR
jgi:hypothetical protein